MSDARRFERSSRLDVPASALAAWHFRRGALERLVPPWSGVAAKGDAPPVSEGSRVTLSIPAGPFRIEWVARHESVETGRSFVDVMERGPFASWRHRHSFLPVEGRPGSSELRDEIEFRLKGGTLGNLAAGFAVDRVLKRDFAWRHRRMAIDLRRHAELSPEPLRIAVSGASGLVGSQLCAFLSTGGHEVRRIVRGRPDAARGDILLDAGRGEVDAAGLEGLDAVVHLAGEPIAEGRWTEAKKKAIRESRVKGTALLARALAGLSLKPRCLVSASAIGFYGDRPGSAIDESAARGSGFLAETCELWERAAREATDAGIRTVHPRIGIVLSGRGGALAKMRLPFSLGLGGPIGSGRQGMSWVALDDLLAMVLFAIVTPAMAGPFNATAPSPVDNATFGRTFGSVLSRPAFLPTPGFALEVAFGELAREALLTGAFVKPARLAAAGFRFDFPTLEDALRFELGRLRD
jgi:uncharacterized protein (TIGR01777 family)